MQEKIEFTHSEAKTFFERKKGYFLGWEKLIYAMGDGKWQYEMTNFLHRWKFRDSFMKDASSFSYWTIRDHENIFSISDIVYGSVYHFWIILLFNNITNPLLSLPLSSEQLLLFCKKKYGVDKIHDIHHYLSGKSGDIRALPPGIQVSSDYEFSKVAVTNYEHEDVLNHEKRYIKLMNPSKLKVVLDEKEEIVKANFIHMERASIKEKYKHVTTAW